MRPFRNDGNRGRNYQANNTPLLKNQLQDLDMELEILRRQREIIKQRQMESQFVSQRQNTYNQPSSSFGRPEPNQNNYANSYHDNFNNKNVQKGQKRSSDRNWKSPSAPKQSRLHPWENLYDYKPSNNPQPLMKVQTPHFKKNKPFSNNKPKQRADFKPTKVTKAKNVISNKFNSNIPKSAKKLSSETKAKKVFGSEEILRPFVEPTPSMKGRLELALGDITKHIKMSKSLDMAILERFTSAGVQRHVKNLIRQRISNVMMNKVVGSAVDIVAHYRKEFPNEVDEEIIKLIKTAPVHISDKQMFFKPITAAESGNIRTFFKTKINQLLKDKMQEMINNLGRLYGDNEIEILDCINDLPDLEEDCSESNTDNKKSEENKDKAEESKDKEGENQDKAEENQNKSEPNKENTEENKDNAEENKDNVVENNEITDSNNVEENIHNIDETNANSDCIDENNTKPVEAMDESNQQEINKDKPEKPNKIEQYYKLMDLLISNRLPKLLVKFKEDFARVMYCEKDFIVAKEMITMEMKDKLRKSFLAANSGGSDGTSQIEMDKKLPAGKTEVDGISEEAAANKSEPNTEIIDVEKETASVANTNNVPQKTPQKSAQLYVMLLGLPALPSKPLIYEFLNKFNPQSIKKHKTVNNLLVIGFNNEEDYNNILAANESKVADATFVIKANEVIAGEKQNTAEQNQPASAVDKEQDDEMNVDESSDANVEEIKESDDTKVEDTSENTDKGIDNDNMVTIEESDENDVQIIEENAEAVEQAAKNVKDASVATPTRSSTRLASATPSTIKTRRASRLAQ